MAGVMSMSFRNNGYFTAHRLQTIIDRREEIVVDRVPDGRKERHQKLFNLIREKGEVTIEDIMDHLDVTEMNAKSIITGATVAEGSTLYEEKKNGKFIYKLLEVKL